VAVQPFYAAAASLRSNGILDLVVEDSLSNDVYVMLGNGDGTFQSPVPVPTSAGAITVTAGDFNGDGKMDLLALEGGCCVQVFPGNGDGTFGTPVTTPLPYGQSGYAMAVGDLNGDGKLDVAVAGESLPNYQVAILLGNGDGTFSADGHYAVFADPLSVAAGRFHGGKAVDLAVGNFLGGSLSVLLGNGDGTFQQAVNYDTWGPTWVAVGDLNGDGKEDLVASNFGSASNSFASTVSVFMGTGDGTFQPGVAYPAGELLNYVAIADFNDDHKPDLVALDHLGNAVITLLNTGVVSFSPTTPLTFPTQLTGTTSAPQTATLTNNGTSPLIISSVSSSGKPFHMQTTCAGSIAPGGNCTITATFTAAAENVTTGTVTIRDSASSKPQVVELVGTGTVVKLAPRQLNFPPQKSGTTSHSKTIQLTNTGSTALDFTSKISIGVGSAFFESNNCLPSLNAGASCSIHVVFAPRYKGTFSESVFITDTGGGSPQSVPLTGTGD